MSLVRLSVTNIFINMLLCITYFSICCKSRDLGVHTVSYITQKTRDRRKGSIIHPYIYSIKFQFMGEYYFQIINEYEYRRLSDICDSRYIRVYVREYTNKMLSPGLQKYEFSFEPVNWNKKHFKEVVKTFLFLAIIFEFVITAIYLGL